MTIFELWLPILCFFGAAFELYCQVKYTGITANSRNGAASVLLRCEELLYMDE